MLVTIRRGREEKGRFHFEKEDGRISTYWKIFRLTRQLRGEVRRAIRKDCDIAFTVIEED